jgi:hypothetical protein
MCSRSAPHCRSRSSPFLHRGDCGRVERDSVDQQWRDQRRVPGPRNSVTMKNTIARLPTRPIALALGALVMPAIRLPTTSGMTVMRIALIQIVPSGSIASAALASV